ncbi:bifunctional adenosylcobinamide kinase/adenosylcobinamide-phosphate guanylyltransferase [Shewanella sp. KCT]|uniref:bifunctional adenosylcobinamide kinase/adenosylcobinamide-phosphate guanylyltransferase n=1 Tax=Shewanella sp. KCT TaxID=2569535 RepID=UPI001182C4E4|nr:bifunctional adenosylcobinamide kinase/adenosylcobinamide-phosphate guanylyltransferase [Shewanella sp. KCT]TVP15474.1 adenosylcobinamide kinase/adenosylcobinamide phosphate guanyltransferase [Shewanella sp. KCT]
MMHLVLGGARSGKSRHGLSLVADYVAKGYECLFVATAQGLDEEMRARIARHQDERREDGLPWQTLECPLHLSACIETHAREKRVILVDCLTLWLTNQLLEGDDWPSAKAALLRALETAPGAVVLISNEVGCGVVPADPLSRRYVDEAGWLHQAIAQRAQQVVLVIAGLPLILKDETSQGAKE